jgi:mannan endo-1,6-alpha-mannosidase
MSALEYQFPDPEKAPASYLEVAVNSFNNMMGRWDESSCGGGLRWQIYPENSYGYDYKNSISNGCAFALALPAIPVTKHMLVSRRRGPCLAHY